MPSTLARILRHGLIAALMLGGLGFVFAQFAGLWYQEKIGDQPAPSGGAEVTEALQWRMPLTMAGWGVAIVVVIELVGSLWRKPSKPVETKPVPDGEAMLLELLDQAEAAEQERAKPPSSTRS
jgi:hypothetical protein